MSRSALSVATPLPDEPEDRLALPGATQRLTVWRRAEDGLSAAQDEVICETPVALQYNGISHAVMLASPADLLDFALGFSLSEAILDHPAQLYDAEILSGEQGVTVAMTIAQSAFMRLKEHRRSLAGRTGCGLCGTESLSQVMAPLQGVLPALDAATAWLTPEALQRAVQSLEANQPLQERTGGCHAALWCSPSGEVLLAREDVGRHNALDKLAGALARAGSGEPGPRQGFVLLTSRASVEMMQKARRAGMAVVVALAAPTQKAVEVAKQQGMTLIGFARSTRWVVCSHPQRLALPD